MKNRKGREDTSRFYEPVDNTRPAMPTGWAMPDPLEERIARMLHKSVLSRNQDYVEPWDEANDFDVEDDLHPVDDSPWEEHFEPTLDRGITPFEAHRYRDEIRTEGVKKARARVRREQQEQLLKKGRKPRKKAKKSGDGAEPRGSSKAP